MKPEKVEDLLKNTNLDTNQNTDDAVLDDMLEKFENSKKISSGGIKTSTIKIILSSPIPNFAVAAIVIILLMVGANLYYGEVNKQKVNEYQENGAQVQQMKLENNLDKSREEILVSGQTKCEEEPTFVISGTVTDALTGKPIAAVKVSDDGYGPKPYRQAVTDSEGRYRYFTWSEEHNIKAEAEGYRTQLKTITGFFCMIDKNEKVINFKLERKEK